MNYSLRDICSPSYYVPPKERLFDPKKVAIISNGRCASSCSLFSVSPCTTVLGGVGSQSDSQITMSQLEGAKTVVVGGKKGSDHQYCGTVGGQSTDYQQIDTELKVRTSRCSASETVG